VSAKHQPKEDTMTDWKQQLAFLDKNEQDWNDTITDKEVTVRVLLAILWQSNRSDSEMAEKWQEENHSGLLFGAISEALQILGVGTYEGESNKPSAHQYGVEDVFNCPVFDFSNQ
jgi:hypothetical protein